MEDIEPVDIGMKVIGLDDLEAPQDCVADSGQGPPPVYLASYNYPLKLVACCGGLLIIAVVLVVVNPTAYFRAPPPSFVCGQSPCFPFSSTDSTPRILVTGGAGFVGGHLIPRLRRDFPSAHIKIVDNLWRGSTANLLDDNGRARVDFAKDLCIADLTEPSVSDCMMQHVDIVFHLADIVAGVDYVFSHEPYVYSQNMRINLNVAESAKRNGVRKFLYTATACSLPKHLQSSYENVAISEQQLYPANPESSYGWSKLMGEYELNLLKSPTFEVGIVRFHNLYGPRIAYDAKRSQALPSLVRKVLTTTTNGELLVWGSGSQYRDFLYIDDAIDGLMATYHRGLNNGTFQLGTGEATTLRHAAAITIQIAKKLVRKTVTARFDISKPEGDRGRVADVSRAREILGWRARTTFVDGMERMFSWIQSDMGKPVAPLTPPRILVIAYGNHRGGPEAWSSMIQHLVYPYGADLATFRNPASNETDLLTSHSKYVWDMKEYDDWADYFRWRTNNSKEFESYAQKGLFGKLSPAPWQFSNTILLAYRHETLYQISAASLQSKYDYFVFTRADMYYACLHTSEVFSDPDTISVPLPLSSDWGGISDRHTVIPRKYLIPALDLVRPFLESTTYNRPGNVESLTKTRWIELGLWGKVKRYTRTFYIVKRPIDNTRWGRPDKKQPASALKNGFAVKYRREYDATTCPLSP
eukprot:GEMP01013966.1.p1 GENE.GEMP01013966.1~~GEMP01013966.1.p1  ORF type:complete len:698 (+),score=91.01 GEMP01013966.1:138-2231(+)